MKLVVSAEDVGILQASGEELLDQPFRLAGRRAGEDPDAGLFQELAGLVAHPVGDDDLRAVFDHPAGDNAVFVGRRHQAADGTVALSINVENEEVVGMAEVAGDTVITDRESNAHMR